MRFFLGLGPGILVSHIDYISRNLPKNVHTHTHTHTHPRRHSRTRTRTRTHTHTQCNNLNRFYILMAIWPWILVYMCSCVTFGHWRFCQSIFLQSFEARKCITDLHDSVNALKIKKGEEIKFWLKTFGSLAHPKKLSQNQTIASDNTWLIRTCWAHWVNLLSCGFTLAVRTSLHTCLFCRPSRSRSPSHL